ncbi:MAG: orotidine-5'-phosphate decarboxylase [Pseudomonadota bacterium]
MATASTRPAFHLRLAARHHAQQTLLCVGIDPLPSALPLPFQRSATQSASAGVYAYGLALAEATADFALAFKPQVAHFAALGAEQELAALIEELHLRHPDIPVVLDAKRGDIGSTAERYALEVFDRYDADAVTLSPYLGPEGLEPFLKWSDRGAFVLCRTSNPDSAWLQRGSGDAAPYRRVARYCAERYADCPGFGLVVGATTPDDLNEVRRIAPQSLLLVPGVGAQGGDAAVVAACGQRAGGGGLLVNVSRGISSQWDVGATGSEGWRAAAEAFHLQMRG